MGNKNENKYENFASYFHNEKRIELTDNIRSDADFKVTQKIYNLREKVGLLEQLPQVEEAWKKIEWRLKEKKSFWISRNFKAFRYAAIYIILVTILSFVGIILFNSSQKEEIFIEISTSTGEIKEVQLPDGSIVWIGANSFLKYNDKFGKENRDIFFNGEAMFDVKKNGTLSFMVTLNDALVSVHGTKFLITDYSAGNKNEIVLLEGKIKYHRKNKTYNLSPGERISENRLTGEIIKDQIDRENYLRWMDGKIYLDNNKLADLTFLLEQWYKAKFIFGNEFLKNYKFTGVIDKRKSLDDNLNMISLTNKVKFQKNEYGIIIINN